MRRTDWIKIKCGEEWGYSLIMLASDVGIVATALLLTASHFDQTEWIALVICVPLFGLKYSSMILSKMGLTHRHVRRRASRV